MNLIDLSLKNYFSVVRTSGVTEYMYILSNFFDISVYTLIVFICFILLILLLRGKKYSVLFTSTILSTGVLVYLMKILFNVARPDGGVTTAFGQSFPSYHATMSTVFFIMLIYIFDDFLNSFSRIVFNTACVLMILAVSFSRIYLGVHWFSDVFFGVLLGGFISYTFIKIFEKWKSL